MNHTHRRSWLLTITLSPCLLVPLSLPAAAQDAPAFKLHWHGQSFFLLETPAGKKVAFDPHAIVEFGRPVVSADMILCSHLHSDHTQVEAIENHKAARVFRGLEASKPGRPPAFNKVDEKVGNVRVRSVQTYHDPEQGLSRGMNAVWVVEANGLVFCHLGDLGHELTDAQVKAIGPVDVLMIPVGGLYTINGTQAKRVVDQLKPKRFVLPMHYGVPEYDELSSAVEFLDEQPDVKIMTDGNELVIPVEAGDAKPAVVVLGWRAKMVP